MRDVKMLWVFLEYCSWGPSTILVPKIYLRCLRASTLYLRFKNDPKSLFLTSFRVSSWQCRKCWPPKFGWKSLLYWPFEIKLWNQHEKYYSGGSKLQNVRFWPFSLYFPTWNSWKSKKSFSSPVPTTFNGSSLVF